MKLLLSLLFFVIPGATGSQTGNGTVSGIVLDTAGKPKVGVRVAALAVPASAEAKSADVLVSIGKTDESGRYALDVPAGRYYIIAGRVDRPTYYPKAGDPSGATIFSIASGTRTEGIDFKVFGLTGVVRDTAGKPEAGVRVALIDKNASPANSCRNLQANETQTDSTGLYRLEVLPGEYSIVVRMGDRTTFYPTSIAISDGTTASGLDIVVPVEAVSSGTRTRDADLYAVAFENSKIGCHSAARLQFQTLLVTFPDSPYASDAKYEMAESYYSEGSPAALASASQQFADYIRFFPNAKRLAEATQRLNDIRQRLQPGR